MINIQQVAQDTFWIGGSDRRLARFENLFPLPNGVSYKNSRIEPRWKAEFYAAFCLLNITLTGCCPAAPGSFPSETESC